MARLDQRTSERAGSESRLHGGFAAGGLFFLEGRPARGEAAVKAGLQNGNTPIPLATNPLLSRSRDARPCSRRWPLACGRATKSNPSDVGRPANRSCSPDAVSTRDVPPPSRALAEGRPCGGASRAKREGPSRVPQRLYR